ncbi:hypothetical protein [Clostridium sp. HBUAS56017]|uniref:hypothetical protein n=1 Tax=Clostridium sp. HBUAS56017 TaxID=2571128 RepID=UPI0011773797|nr:hypothetical protein [Clostridium sp. HBUAS56017]
MIKKIIFTTIIIISLITLIFAIMIISKDDEKTKMIKSISTTTPKQIEIIKTGNPVLKKVVTSDEDMKKIISFIQNIKVQKKSNEEIKGWMYSITITNSNDEKHSVTLGMIANFDTTSYAIDQNVNNEFQGLYDSLDYNEIDPL